MKKMICLVVVLFFVTTFLGVSSATADEGKAYLPAEKVLPKWAKLGDSDPMKKRDYFVDQLDGKWAKWTGSFVKIGSTALDEGLLWFKVQGQIVLVEMSQPPKLEKKKKYQIEGKFSDTTMLPDEVLGKPKKGQSITLIILSEATVTPAL